MNDTSSEPTASLRVSTLNDLLAKAGAARSAAKSRAREDSQSITTTTPVEFGDSSATSATPRSASSSLTHSPPNVQPDTFSTSTRTSVCALHWWNPAHPTSDCRCPLAATSRSRKEK